MKMKRRKTIPICILTIKYWLQGDTWKKAKEYATAIVRGFKRRNYGKM